MMILPFPDTFGTEATLTTVMLNAGNEWERLAWPCYDV